MLRHAGTLLMEMGNYQDAEAMFHAMTSEYKHEAYPWLALGVFNLRSWHLYCKVHPSLPACAGPDRQHHTRCACKVHWSASRASGQTRL